MWVGKGFSGCVPPELSIFVTTIYYTITINTPVYMKQSICGAGGTFQGDITRFSLVSSTSKQISSLCNPCLSHFRLYVRWNDALQEEK